MTFEEALETKIRMCGICRNEAKPTKASCENCSDKVAIECIEKQIPKKPAETDAYPHRVYCSTDGCGFTFVFNKELVKVMGDLLQWSYCPKCGQAIDWSDEE